MGVPSTKIGEESINGTQSVRFGTFGEGIISQLRVGYFFNKTWGVDVRVGYLYGSDQTIIHHVWLMQHKPPWFKRFPDAEAIGRGRAYEPPSQ